MSEPGRIVSVNRGTIAPLKTPRGVSRSAIDKRAVTGPVAVGELGLAGDEQADPRFHGGPDKAVYAYAAEDLAWWEHELDRPIPPGFIGENLTTSGVDLNALRSGDELHAGTVVLRTTMPRVPCAKLAARIALPGFERKFARALRTGVYFAVDKPGKVAAGDAVTIVRSGEGPTILEMVAEAYHVPIPDRKSEPSGALG